MALLVGAKNILKEVSLVVEIQQVGDDFFIAKGQFAHAPVEKAWMAIKKGELSIPKSVVMTSNYKPETDCTTFNFVVATNVVEDAIASGKVVGKYDNELHESMKKLHQELLNQATCALADRIVALDDHDARTAVTPVLPVCPAEGCSYA